MTASRQVKHNSVHVIPGRCQKKSLTIRVLKLPFRQAI